MVIGEVNFKLKLYHNNMQRLDTIVAEKRRTNKPWISFEFFPPKTEVLLHSCIINLLFVD